MVIVSFDVSFFDRQPSSNFHTSCIAAFPLSCDPLRTPRVSIRSWSWDFFEILGFNTKWCGSIRFVALGCDRIMIAQFLVTRSATIWSLLQIRSDTFEQDCPDRVHDGVQSTYDHHDRGSRFGTMWFAYMRIHVLMLSSRTDTPCCDRIRLWSRCRSRSPSGIHVPMFWATIGPEGYIYNTSLCLSRYPTIGNKIWYELIRGPRLVHDKDQDSNRGADRDSGSAAYKLYRIVRVSDYSPASVLFMLYKDQVCQKKPININQGP